MILKNVYIVSLQATETASQRVSNGFFREIRRMVVFQQPCLRCDDNSVTNALEGFTYKYFAMSIPV